MLAVIGLLSRHDNHLQPGGELHAQRMCSCFRRPPDLMWQQVLSNISLRLADMHDAGYVHRDLKPANVMWLPRQNRWTVIDFGCVARVGEQAPLSFTLAYAAPEVAHAFLLEQRSIESTPQLDAWSLGVMAWELLTGAPPFDLVGEGVAEVRPARMHCIVNAMHASHARTSTCPSWHGVCEFDQALFGSRAFFRLQVRCTCRLLE